MIKLTISEKEITDNPSECNLGRYVIEKFEHEKFVIENSFDTCVICGKESPYTKNTHIDSRIGYIEGCGQSCFQPKICDKY